MLISEYYESLMSLVQGLTEAGISPTMWKVFVMLYDVFKTDAFDYFTGLFQCPRLFVCALIVSVCSYYYGDKGILEML